MFSKDIYISQEKEMRDNEHESYRAGNKIKREIIEMQITEKERKKREIIEM